MRSFLIYVSALFLLFPYGLILQNASVLDSPAAQDQVICSWKQISVTEALSSGDESRSVSRNGNTLTTSYAHSGATGCGQQIFHSYHTWTEPGKELQAGQDLSFDVSASWDLDGQPQCSSLTAGVSTWLKAGLTTITARDSHIAVSVDPSGSVSEQGTWTVFSGSSPGDTMSISAHGETGGVGGTIFYKYSWQCVTPEAPTEPPATSTPEPSPTPSGSYNLTVGSKGATDPLNLTISLVEYKEGSPSPVVGAELRVSALEYEGNEKRLAEEYLAPSCRNCEWREASGERLGHLAQPDQPIILQTDQNGEAEITFFLDFSKLGSEVPRRDSPLEIPIAVEYLGPDEESEDILAEMEYRAVLNAIGVVTAITYKQAQMFDIGTNPLPINIGPLDTYYDDPGTQDGPRTIYREQRVLVDWIGRESIGSVGSTPGIPLQAGTLLHSGDRVTINACDMVTNRMENGLPAGAPGVVWVKVRFFDSTEGKVGVNGDICKSAINFGSSPDESGWLSNSSKFYYWAAEGAVNAVIGHYLLPYKYLEDLSSFAKFLAWTVGNESGGWSTVYIKVKSAFWVNFDENGTMQITVREGEPNVYIEPGGGVGVPVYSGQTAFLSSAFQSIEIENSETETAAQADEELSEVYLSAEGESASSTQESWDLLALTGLIPGWALIVLAALACFTFLGTGGVGAWVIIRQVKKRSSDRETPPAHNLNTSNWYLEIISGPKSGSRHMLGQHTRLGRKPDNELTLNDMRVSSYHAKIQMLSGGMVISDLESRNGTFVNGVQITRPTYLSPEDHIVVGKTLMRVYGPEG